MCTVKIIIKYQFNKTFIPIKMIVAEQVPCSGTYSTIHTQWARKFKKVQVIFSTSKIDFWSFLKWQKMDVGQKIFFCEIDLFDFTSFFWLDFFNFLAHCV